MVCIIIFLQARRKPEDSYTAEGKMEVPFLRHVTETAIGTHQRLIHKAPIDETRQTGPFARLNILIKVRT